MKDKVKQKDFFVYWKPGSQNMRDYFTKHHPPHIHKEICATYLYMANVILKINQKIVHKWENVVLTTLHTFVVCRILKHVVASASKAEVRGLFHNGQTTVPLIITLHEIGFTQPPTPIKTDNSVAEGIVTATVRQKISKAMDM